MSGHAVLIAAIAGLVTPYLPGRWKIVPWIVVALVMVTRVYVGAHNPLDVICGAGVWAWRSPGPSTSSPVSDPGSRRDERRRDGDGADQAPDVRAPVARADRRDRPVAHRLGARHRSSPSTQPHSAVQGIDDRWLRWMVSLRTPWLTRVAKIREQHRIGESHTAAAGVGRRCSLMWRRRWLQLGAFLGAVVTSELCIGPLKALVDRPRPPDSLIGTSGASFPSGHAIAGAVTAFGLGRGPVAGVISAADGDRVRRRVRRDHGDQPHVSQRALVDRHAGRRMHRHGLGAGLAGRPGDRPRTPWTPDGTCRVASCPTIRG